MTTNIQMEYEMKIKEKDELILILKDMLHYKNKQLDNLVESYINLLMTRSEKEDKDNKE